MTDRPEILGFLLGLGAYDEGMTTPAAPIDPPFPPSADPLGEVLHALRMSGVFYTRSQFTEPWGLELPAMTGCLMFHVVTAGRCLLHVEGDDQPHTLQPGMFVLVPHGEGHRLLSAPDAPADNIFDLHREQVTERYEVLRHGGGGAKCNMICGAVRFDQPAAERLVRLLPRHIAVDTWQSPQSESMQNTLRLMAAEVETMRPGGETIVTRLADILVIQAIRAWMAQDPAARVGWLGALHDPQVGRAMLLVQREPGRAWSVAELAGAVAMSRSAFAARFTELVGETPMQYVRRWKMHHAAAWFREQDLTVSEAARQLGYESEASFSRAFKRVMGVSPGSVAAA